MGAPAQNATTPAQVDDWRRFVMNLSLVASVFMLGGKVAAFVITSSTAILSDAAESVVHGAATALAWFSLRYAERPADRNHPYGHGRIAYFSAGFEGGLVLAVSLSILLLAAHALIRGKPLHQPGIGLAIAGSLALINAALGTALVRVGRKHNSLILMANGKHVLSDMWTTLAAIFGIALVMITGQAWLDPVAALLIGIYILVSGASLLRSAVRGLMDEVDPNLARQLVDGLENAVRNGWITGFHQLRCRQVHDRIWVDVHLLVPGELTTVVAHRRATRVEEALRVRLPRAEVVITSHVEPSDHHAAHPGGHQDLDDPMAMLSSETRSQAPTPP